MCCGLAVEIDRFGHRQLHASGKFVAGDAGGELLVAGKAGLVLFIKKAECVACRAIGRG